MVNFSSLHRRLVACFIGHEGHRGDSLSSPSDQLGSQLMSCSPKAESGQLAAQESSAVRESKQPLPSDSEAESQWPQPAREAAKTEVTQALKPTEIQEQYDLFPIVSGELLKGCMKEAQATTSPAACSFPDCSTLLMASELDSSTCRHIKSAPLDCISSPAYVAIMEAQNAAEAVAKSLQLTPGSHPPQQEQHTETKPSQANSYGIYSSLIQSRHGDVSACAVKSHSSHPGQVSQRRGSAATACSERPPCYGQLPRPGSRSTFQNRPGGTRTSGISSDTATWWLDEERPCKESCVAGQGTLGDLLVPSSGIHDTTTSNQHHQESTDAKLRSNPTNAPPCKVQTNRNGLLNRTSRVLSLSEFEKEVRWTSSNTLVPKEGRHSSQTRPSPRRSPVSELRQHLEAAHEIKNRTLSATCCAQQLEERRRKMLELQQQAEAERRAMQRQQTWDPSIFTSTKTCASASSRLLRFKPIDSVSGTYSCGRRLVLESCTELEEARDNREAMLQYLHFLTVAKQRTNSSHQDYSGSSSPQAKQRSILGNDDEGVQLLS